MDCSLPGSSVRGIFQARVLGGMPLPFSSVQFSSVTQSCPTLCDPKDCSLPGSSVRGIFQARVLSGVPFPSPGDIPDPGIEPRSPALQADALPSEPSGKPQMWLLSI